MSRILLTLCKEYRERKMYIAAAC